MARRRFAGTGIQHRRDAGGYAKEARVDAQRARTFARAGNCEAAVFHLGLTNYHAGMAAMSRKWAARGKLRSRYLGGSHMGARMASLNNAIIRACRIGGRR